MRNLKVLHRLYIRNFLRKKILPIMSNFTCLPPNKYTKNAAEKLKEKSKNVWDIRCQSSWARPNFYCHYSESIWKNMDLCLSLSFSPWHQLLFLFSHTFLAGYFSLLILSPVKHLLGFSFSFISVPSVDKGIISVSTPALWLLLSGSFCEAANHKRIYDFWSTFH